jgi:uncharacterized protein YjiS (DUF1127 family)
MDDSVSLDTATRAGLGLSGSIRAWFGEAARRWAERRRFDREFMELMSATDRDLADIGLTRYDLRMSRRAGPVDPGGRRSLVPKQRMGCAPSAARPLFQPELKRIGANRHCGNGRSQPAQPMSGRNTHHLTAFTGQRNAGEGWRGLRVDHGPEILDQPLRTAAAHQMAHGIPHGSTPGHIGRR